MKYKIIRYWIRFLARVLAVVGGNLLIAAATAATIPSSSIPVITLEGEALPVGVTANKAKLALVPSPQRPGGRALEVSFDAKASNSGVTIKPPQSWDWSALGDCHLAFDVVNTGDYSVDLIAVIGDKSGASTTRRVSIPVGGRPRTCFFVIKGPELLVDSGQANNPPAWPTHETQFVGGKRDLKQLDAAQIASINLHTDVIAHDKRLVLENFRVVPNPGFDPNFLVGICDEFGQNAKVEFPIKVHSAAELKARAEAELAELAKSKPMADRSKWGGWKNGPRLKATGYFRTEKVQGKWSLVDPDGYLYFANGIANVRMANTPTMTGVDFHEPTVRAVDPEDLTPEDSKGFIQTSAEARNTRFIISELRNKMFTWLPAYDDPLAAHYSYERSVHLGPVAHGESFSFYEANLERRYGRTGPGSYLAKWRDVTADRMLDWGFTCLGNWADPSFYHLDKIPYFANGWIIGNYKTVSSGLWAPMPDPFDPEFVRRAKLTLKAVAAEVQDSPWCVGVFVDNEKSWGKTGSFESQYVIVISALNLSAAESPTKAEFVRILNQKYGTIEALNKVWETSLPSWEALTKGVTVTARNDAVRADFSAMLLAYCNEYFRVVRDALREVLPHHLYMGVRMAGWGMNPEVVAAAKKYTDVVSYNHYKEGFREADWTFLKEVDMPSIIGEFHMGATSDTGMFHPGLIYAADQADRARMFKKYVEAVADNPYFVGAHWFQYTDSPLTGRTHDGEAYNIGFVSNTDIPYPEMVKAAKELNSGLYKRRFGELKAK
ncbi:MAG: beta-galactosidase [Lacunisphaera sp.]|nr:beta-galactosidase [Lacunisphaera sp.]